jgi:hypothetical protein
MRSCARAGARAGARAATVVDRQNLQVRNIKTSI